MNFLAFGEFEGKNGKDPVPTWKHSASQVSQIGALPGRPKLVSGRRTLRNLQVSFLINSFEPASQ
jgi:hypothetical protein